MTSLTDERVPLRHVHDVIVPVTGERSDRVLVVSYLGVSSPDEGDVIDEPPPRVEQTRRFNSQLITGYGQ